MLRPREAFDDVVTRLINAAEKANELLNTLEGQIQFRERQRERLEKTTRLD
jgi:hypothetical protein